MENSDNNLDKEKIKVIIEKIRKKKSTLEYDKNKKMK